MRSLAADEAGAEIIRIDHAHDFGLIQSKVIVI
jgi:hypothetical protein